MKRWDWPFIGGATVGLAIAITLGILLANTKASRDEARREAFMIACERVGKSYDVCDYEWKRQRISSW